MRKKVVITSNTSWFVWNFFRSSISEFLDNGIEVFVVAPEDKYTKLLLQEGCQFHALTVDRSGVNPLSELKTITQLVKTLRTICPDVVLNFTPKLNIYSLLVAKCLGFKVVNSIAGLGSIISENGVKSYIGKALLRLTQPFADHIIFQNDEDRGIYIGSKLIKAAKTSQVKGIGVELSDFYSVDAPDDGVVRFILFARMLVNKGVIDFVNAAIEVDKHYQTLDEGKLKYQFDLLGFVDEKNPHGISAQQLQQWDDTTSVSYLGETDDVFNIVKNYDCVVLPSFYREGVPQCLIEACAMAKPIITTDNVGCRDTVVHGENGYMIQPQSVTQLKSTMIRMIELSHQQRLAMGRKGRIKAENDFSHITVSKHYMKIINEL